MQDAGSHRKHVTAPDEASLHAAVAAVPAGSWGVGVSGGADSVALLRLLIERYRTRRDIRVHVIHLDHQTRGGQSGADAQFVRELCEGNGVACSVALRDEVERWMVGGTAGETGSLPSNVSAR